MHFKTDEEPGRKVLDYAGSTYTLDLVTRGGMGSPAREIRVPAGSTGGTVGVRHKDDWSYTAIELYAGDNGYVAYVAEICFGTVAKYNPAVTGSYPVTITGVETLVFTLDTGTDHASGTITFAPAAGNYTQAQLLALLNAAINAVIPPPGGHTQALAADEGSDESSLSGRSGGTGGEVDITTIHATLATALGWAVSTTNGVAFASPAGNVRVTW
jgi:hypothetical protein